LKNKYSELIEQTFDFPTEEFNTNERGELEFWGINLMDMVAEYGSPLQLIYLPKIAQNINRAKTWFKSAFEKHEYKGNYNYCYCTKSSHFSYVIKEVLANDTHLETSSAFDIEIIKQLAAEGLLRKDRHIVCNGFKTPLYISNIVELIEDGFENVVVVLDNKKELELLKNKTDKVIKIGIRIASEEEPKFEFYTSRLGIGYKYIIPFYEEEIKNNDQFELQMLHFFINTGIRDNAYYWNEINKSLTIYTKLKKICSTLNSFNIGGGFPIKRSLNASYDYAYMIEEIVGQIKQRCMEAEVKEPHIFTEFGSFTVGESGVNIFSILHQKQQNDKERWNMIDGSFMTTLPDAWAISERFIMLPLNRWDEEYERVFLGGLTCDSDDYYNSEQHVNAIYLPKYNTEKTQYIAFFHTGSYQDTLSGYGGLKHCLIPSPQKVLVWKDEDGKIQHKRWAELQGARAMLNILGY
jgi:arginine decarboxylase